MSDQSELKDFLVGDIIEIVNPFGFPTLAVIADTQQKGIIVGKDDTYLHVVFPGCDEIHREAGYYPWRFRKVGHVEE